MVKEDGNTMLHTTQTWADKAMTNTSQEGCERIKAELKSLNDQWDAFVTDVPETKAALEACQMQWSDYDDRYQLS